jgi:hypothetical protein
MKNVALILGLATLLLLPGFLLAAEGPAGIDTAAEGKDVLSRKAVIVFYEAVKTWLAVYRQTREEPDMVSLLDELCSEIGYRSYRKFSEAAEKALGAKWGEITSRNFHGAWAKAKMELERDRKKWLKEAKAGPKDPRYSGVQDKMIIVYLKNGSTIEGIARKGILAEKRVRIRKKGGKKLQMLYLTVPATEKDAGIRVWYINNIEGFSLVPYSIIDPKRGVEVVRSLTPKESEDIFKAIKSKEMALRAAEKTAKAEEKRFNAERDATEKVLRESAIARKTGQDVDKARKIRQELLGKFPPSAGWSKKRLREIRHRWIVLHQPPNELEREFLAKYEKWQKAKDDQDYIDGKK